MPWASPSPRNSCAPSGGRKIIDHRTWVFAGDGCLMEGVSHEAIALAGRQELSRLTVIWDNNGITIDGKVGLADRTDQMARFAAAGWDVFDCDGHDPEDIDRALTAAKASPRPAMIACKTHIALGHAAQDTAKGHGALTDAEQLAATKEAYGWPHGAFEVPADIKAEWEAIGARGRADREEWETRFALLSDGKQAEFERAFAGESPKRLSATIRALKKQISTSRPKVATRKASEMALEVINPILPETIGGSADLTGSNNTQTADLGIFEPENRKGRYIHFGIREHAMAAAMNGMALHGGVRPYGGTFLCFADYARPSMRLSALMGVPVRYVMTHDSIGLGEDGPTHQPVEHLAMLRATPNMLVFRPADAVETAEAWEIALQQTSAPAVLALSRQNLPTVRTEHKTKEPHRAGRLRAGRGRGQAPGSVDGHRLGGCHRAGRARPVAGRGHRHPRRLHALLGDLRGSGRGLSPPRPAGRPRSRGRGGRGSLRLGPLALWRAGQAREIGLRGDARLRRLGPGKRPLRAFWHHRRGRGRKGEIAAEIGGCAE